MPPVLFNILDTVDYDASDMPLLRSSLGGNEYTFVFADEISNPRCSFSNDDLF